MLTFQPPPNYKPVPSALDGITVYAPVTEAPKEEAPKTYTCPNCGATTRYDIAAGGVACEYCGYKAAAQVKAVGLQAQTFEFTLETLDQAEHGWGVVRKQLHCDNCGAEMAIAEGAISVTCPFCGSNKVNVMAAAAEQLRPRFLIPFKVTSEVIKERANVWLGQGWFHPSELKNLANIARFAGVYLPFWTFDADIDSDWEAEVGYERQERYYDSSDKEWKTRTVIDWRWENGSVRTNVVDLLILGSSHLSRRIMERLYPFDLRALVPYSPDFLAGWQAHAYDMNLPEAWELGKEVMRERAKVDCNNDIPTSHVRNFSMTADFENETWRYLLLPVYLAAYQFEGKVYQVMVNGQTGAVAGQKPVAWWKLWLAIAAMLAPGLLLILIGLPLLALGGAGILPLILGAILLVPAGIFSFIFFRQAVDSEAA